MRNFVRGTPSDDILIADDTDTLTMTTRETYLGRAGNDVFHFYRGAAIGDEFGYTGRPETGDPDFSDRFIGGSGDDKLTNLRLLFIDESDYDGYAPTSFDGGKGIDTISFQVVMSLRAVTTLELNRFEAQTRSVEIREFDIQIWSSPEYTTNHNIVGSSDREHVHVGVNQVLDIEEANKVNVTADLGGGDDMFSFVSDQDIIVNLSVETGAGSDTVIINNWTLDSSFVEGAQISTGNGRDTVVLEGMHSETVRTGKGSDDIYLLSGNFVDAPDTVYTGGGKDRIFVELDAYSKLGRIKDFAEAKDQIVLDRAEFRRTDVVFSEADHETGDEPNLFMDNANGKLFYGNNVMLDFGGATALTAANFVVDDWAF